jgi:photosystem II stability/assembly factor-like uncharacterized protein
MHRSTTRRAVPLLAAFALVLGVVAVGTWNHDADGLPRAAQELRAEGPGHGAEADKDFREPAEGIEHGGAGGEAAEQMTAQEQWAQARTAPGIVAPGGYSSAYAALTGLSSTGGSWDEITNLPYDADDPDYRDYFSNSGGGSGLVTGRITALAADDDGHVYAGGADGGVWRSTSGGGSWTPIADSLPSLSSGDLQIDDQGRLWYATGEANTGATSYVGTGVYLLDDPTTGSFSPSDRVGGDELESTTINAVRFAGDKVWIATLRGVWWHSLSGDKTTPWTQSFAPNPSYLPGGTNAGDANAAYKNIVNDVAIDPKDADHIIAAVGWRSGDAYNGFYETRDGGDSWTRVNLTGGLDKSDIGNATFAWAADGSRLYVMNQSPKRIQSGAAIPMTYLDGIYVSKTGSLDGPWTRIATADKLGAASGGSALSKNYGVGYRPGIQSWYNQFLTVDPSDPKHVIAGLEEVYETKDGGSDWSTIGPYWNFYFGCWAPDSLYPPNGEPNRCPQTTHPDQHSVAIGSMSPSGEPYLIVGNDGGIYKRPLHGETNRNGNATDWTSLNDGSIDALQYYGMGVGALHGNGSRPDMGSGDDVLVSGGMQDNGGSLLRPGASKMVSNFGGDGGDVLVDPDNGCNIVQEYVYLSLELTQTCANPPSLDALLDPSQATTFDVAPPDINARFIAPFAANSENIDEWVAGGNSLWFQDNGFAIRSGSAWQKVHTFSSPVQVATATSFSGDTIIAGWCGPCNNAGFARGIVVLHRDGDTWSVAHSIDASDMTTIPNRYVGDVAVDPSDDQHLLVGLNGFSRRFTEGPGAGIGHVFESTDGGATWSNVDAGSFPDVPVNSVRVLPTGGTVVGTDLGVLYRASGGTDWTRLGDNFPTTVAMDVEYSATDDMVYVATHGRGIWRIDNPDSGS